jgi:hypothetical protein
VINYQGFAGQNSEDRLVQQRKFDGYFPTKNECFLISTGGSQVMQEGQRISEVGQTVENSCSYFWHI